MGGLYLHIPFCERKCIYCDFYSEAVNEFPGHQRRSMTGFLASLSKEIALRDRPEFRIPYRTIYLGGGTPSLLPPSDVDTILKTLARVYPIRPDAEITMEVNPGTVSQVKLQDYRAAGINRLSIGVQSFHDEELRFLSRIHTSSDARQCIEDGRNAGFDNISVDLMFALPGQTLAGWHSSLESAVNLKVDHVSAYSLTLEPGTPFAGMVQRKEVVLTDESIDAEMYRHAIRFLTSAGYEQYEVSNFARPGYMSRHNSGYWDHSPYLGFGPSAHSFFNGTRWWNVSSVDSYERSLSENRLPVESSETIGTDVMIEEEVFLGLRSGGVDLVRLSQKYGHEIGDQLRPQLEGLIARSLARSDGDRFWLTEEGYLLCDEICSSIHCEPRGVACASG